MTKKQYINNLKEIILDPNFADTPKSVKESFYSIGIQIQEQLLEEINNASVSNLDEAMEQLQAIGGLLKILELSK